MTRKLLTSLLCLMLAVMLPLCAMADTRHTLQLVPGDELASEQALKDLFDTLSFSLTTGDTAATLSVGLSGTDVASIALTADAAGIYVQSNLLSDDVLYVSWDDAIAFMENTMKESDMDEEAIVAMKQVLEQYKVTIPAMLSGEMSTGPMSGMTTPDEALAMLEKMFPDDPAMIQFYKDMFAKMVIEDGTFTDDARDTATQKYSLTMDGNDMAAICDTQYMRTLLEQSLAVEEKMTAEELAAAVDETIAETKKVFTENEMLMTMEVYTVDNGMALVGMEMGMSMTIAEDDESETMTMNMNYDRLTSDAGVNHMGDLSMTIDDEGTATMVLDLTQGNDGVSEGMFAMLADEEQVTFLYRGEDVDGVRVSTLDIYDRDDAVAIIVPAAAERPLFSFKVTSAEVSGDALATISAANAESAVNVLKLSEEEMKALDSEVQTRVMQVMYTGLSLLPASVLQMFMYTAE